MQQTVASTGTIEPAQQANLNFGVSGQVTAVDVSSGQTVAAGQTLATVDPAALQDDVDQAEANLSAAQAKLSSDQSTGASTSEIDSDQAAVTSAQTQLTTAEANLADASLTSTIAGTVASVDLSVGQQVTGSGSGGDGAAAASASASDSSTTAQVVVISTGSYLVNATVDDTQVGQVAAGDQVDITPSGSTTTVYGTVSSVGLIASTTSDVATFPVVVAVTGSPSGLYAGSSATLSIIVKQIDDATEVPTAAISYGSSGQATVVEVENGRHVTQPVTTGEVSGGDTQITTGLSPGDKVLEQVVKFNRGGTGGARSLFGGSGTGGFTGGGGGGFRGGAGGGGGFNGAGGSGG
jgi:multidrug efflux pump subunit AcrA (membrane-fusion protein)